MTKTCVGIIFGGRSLEHEISLQSARSIVDAIDKERFDVVLLGIDKQGLWHISDSFESLLQINNLAFITLNNNTNSFSTPSKYQKNRLVWIGFLDALFQLDVIFPITHGTFGEDGSLQGLLRMVNIPCVGSSVLGSAISMDKDVSKRLLRDAGLMITPFFTLTRNQRSRIHFDQVTAILGLPLFVKPANQGSSIGVSKVIDQKSFEKALVLAFSVDHKILVETAVVGRELECAVLGNNRPEVSVCGEVILGDDFYSYQTKYKYIHETDASIVIPADIADTVSDKIRDIAVQAFQVLNCSDMARVDVFLTQNGDILINEINTLPGFANASMYPKLWQASGLSRSNLITRLIDLAVIRHQQDQALFID